VGSYRKARIPPSWSRERQRVGLPVGGFGKLWRAEDVYDRMHGKRRTNRWQRRRRPYRRRAGTGFCGESTSASTAMRGIAAGTSLTRSSTRSHERSGGASSSSFVAASVTKSSYFVGSTTRAITTRCDPQRRGTTRAVRDPRDHCRRRVIAHARSPIEDAIVSGAFGTVTRATGFRHFESLRSGAASVSESGCPSTSPPSRGA
jgi:hypothetical protein